MNVLMISDVYFPRVNGVSTSILTFRRELQRLGHGVTLVVPDYGLSSDDEHEILRIPARRVPRDPEDRMMRIEAVLGRLDTFKRQNFDIVHIQTPFVAHYAGKKLSRWLNIPRIETYHTLFEQYLFHYIPFLPKFMLRALARRFSQCQCNNLDGLVVPSRAIREVMVQRGVNARMAVIPTGIGLTLSQDGDGAAFRVQHGISPERPTLVHVGRVAFEKSIDFLLYVVQELRRTHPDILLIIAGEGPAEQHLQQLGEKLGLRDHLLFIGYLSRERALTECYRAGDVFVFAAPTETQGLVLLEAMSLGVPVVSTAVMGTRDILQDGEGALVAQEEVVDFAAKVRRVLGDAELRRQLGERGRVYAQQWGAEGPTHALVTFYQEILEAH